MFKYFFQINASDRAEYDAVKIIPKYSIFKKLYYRHFEREIIHFSSILHTCNAQEAHIIILQGYDQRYRNVLFFVLTLSEEKWTYCLSREESVEVRNSLRKGSKSNADGKIVQLFWRKMVFIDQCW